MIDQHRLANCLRGRASYGGLRISPLAPQFESPRRSSSLPIEHTPVGGWHATSSPPHQFLGARRKPRRLGGEIQAAPETPPTGRESHFPTRTLKTARFRAHRSMLCCPMLRTFSRQVGRFEHIVLFTVTNTDRPREGGNDRSPHTPYGRGGELDRHRAAVPTLRFLATPLRMQHQSRCISPPVPISSALW